MTAEKTDELFVATKTSEKTGIEVGTDTGVIWTCPCCNRTYHLIHRQAGKKILKHDFEEVVGE